jgi:hypothetical protein
MVIAVVELSKCDDLEREKLGKWEILLQGTSVVFRGERENCYRSVTAVVSVTQGAQPNHFIPSQMQEQRAGSFAGQWTAPDTAFAGHRKIERSFLQTHGYH